MDGVKTLMDKTAERNRTGLWADLAVLSVALVWGASYPVAKGALSHAPVLVLIFYRFVTTAAVMAIVARRDLVRSSKGDWAAGLTLGAILFSIFLAETWGIALTTASNAALIISLCAVVTPFLEYGLRGQLPPRGVTFGAGAAVSGVAVLSGGMTAFGAGDLFILGAAVLRAVMVISTKRLMAGRALSSSAVTAQQSLMVSGLALVVLLSQGAPSTLLVDAGSGFWGAVGFLSLFCTIGAFYIQNAAVRRTTPTRVSLLMGTEPLFGFALAWLLRSEPATAMTLFGAGLIVGGTLWAVVVERRHGQR